MAFQIVEYAFDADTPDQRTKKVIPESFATRDQAVGEIQALIALRGEGGFNEEQDYWWANDKRGLRYHFLVEGN
ncbi:MAG: hypothetical protein ABUL48_02195 [Pseudorhodoplanes sp.]